MKEIVLVIGAHPDDIEFMAGGTIAKFSKEGKEVYFLITTNGQRGSLQPDADPKTIISTREAEARAAAEVLGVKDVIFLGYEDGFLDRTPHLELREKYVYQIRKLKPRIVMTFDPWNTYEQHSDHRKVALAAFESCYFCHYPLFHPEFKLAKHFVSEIWLFRSPTPNTWISLNNKEVRTKIKAIMKHASQVQMLKEEIFGQLEAEAIDYSLIQQVDNQTLVDIFVRNMTEEAGKKKGYKFAEAFKVVTIGYAEDVKRILSAMKS
ncbi:MAG: PIG-L family deacetylase [Candidatus Helarchaeota archaeon]|nr:PIG-L family deacetylase [Candidatus Helarchaeota archaeon]